MTFAWQHSVNFFPNFPAFLRTQFVSGARISSLLVEKEIRRLLAKVALFVQIGIAVISEPPPVLDI